MSQPHVVVVACASLKLGTPAAAQDLYTSTLFIEARRFAQARGDLWFILSALHGLVKPSDVLAPYERTLSKLPPLQRRAWAASVATKLLDLLPNRATVTLLAGKKYREYIETVLRDKGVQVDAPLAALGIGRQIQWLQAANRGESPAWDRI